MMRPITRLITRVPVSRYFLAILFAALILPCALIATSPAATAAGPEKREFQESTTSWPIPRIPRSAPLGMAIFSVIASLHEPPALLSAIQPAPVPQASDDIVISQVYGGGGDSGSTYKNDFIELFNQGTTTVSLDGWTVQYAAVNGNSWQRTTLSGSLSPGHYYLVKEAQGAGGTQQLPTADVTGTLAMSATGGKVALLNGAGCLNGPADVNGNDCSWAGTVIKDLVGSGNGATSYEGSGPAVGQSATTAILRGAKGCIDLDNNSADFDPGAATPRNSSTVATQCVTPNPSTTVVISEFRTRGPNGVNDEFVELYNKTTSPINIGGWKIKTSKSNGQISTRVTITANTILPGHYHFLATNTAAAGYNGSVPGNQTYTTDITDNGGLAITRADDSIVDQVGLNTGSAFKEGRVLDQFTTNTDRSYERRPGGVSGSGQDTDDSRSDFAIRPSCNPQNLQSSPVPDSTIPSRTGVKIVHIDVGQGDSTLIIGPTRTLLFDGGIAGSGTQIRNVLDANGITALDYFVAGHYHADHIGAIDEVINSGIAVGTSFDRGGSYATQSFTEYAAAVANQRSTIALNQQIDLGGGCVLTCIAVDGYTNHGIVSTTDENDKSIALVLRYGTFDFLIASDLTGGGNSTANIESFIARDAGDVDVLHVNQHGSAVSNNQTLISKSRPQQAVISVGNANSYGHPSQAAIDRLSASSTLDTIWQTESGSGGTAAKVRVGGNITIVTDGTGYSVTNSLNGLSLSYLTDGITGTVLPGPEPVAGGPYTGNVGTSISFNGSQSTDPAAAITSYQWNFGDGGTGTGVTAAHTYAAAGSYDVTLTLTDGDGAMASARTTANINASPTITLTAPVQNAVLTAPADITVNASADDSDGTISKVDFYQGATLLGTDTATPYSVSWNAVAAGSYSLTAKATDNSGSETTSNLVSITVNVNTAPTVSLTSPTAGEVFVAGSSVTLSANAWDNDGTVSKVEFYQGTTLIGTDTVSPYAIGWDSVPAGSYSLTAKATDNNAAVSTSSAVSFTVNPPNVPPTVTLTAPTDNSVFISGADVTLSADATDSDGTISKVEFFQGGIKIGEDTSAPYTITWHNLGAGSYTLTALAWDNASAVAESLGINISSVPQSKQYVGWYPITNGIDLGNGSVRKTSTGVWDFSASSTQTLLPGDGYFESTASNYNQAITVSSVEGASWTFLVGTGGWAAIYENGVEVAATFGHIPSETITQHVAGDRYRLEVTNGILRYVRYRGVARAVVFVSSARPSSALRLGLASSFQNSEWQRTTFSQLTTTGTWSSITSGIDLGNGSLRKTSSDGWGFNAVAARQLLRGDGYVESTPSAYNQAISLSGGDGAARTLLVGTGGWAAIYENGLEVAATSGFGPSQTISPHASGDRYRLEITAGNLRYVRYRAGSREVLFSSPSSLPVYPLSLSLNGSPLNAEWQNTIIAQTSQVASWSTIVNGIDLGEGAVRKTSSGGWDFSASLQQTLAFGNGYFESTPSSYNQAISVSGANGAGRTIVIGTGGWMGIYEDGVEVASTYGRAPNETIASHYPGDRYRLEIRDGKLRYVRYRSGTRAVMFTSPAPLPAYPLGFSVGASTQNSEWQNSIFSDHLQEHNDAAFVSQSVPSTMAPGQSYGVSVKLRNTGASTWTSDDYKLASDNPPNNLTWATNNVNLSADVPPGAEANFNFTVTAPATPGTYNFQWQTNQVAVERFGALTPNLSIASVNGLPAVALTSPADNAVFSSGTTVTVAATASDSDGTITNVEFFQGSMKLGEDSTAPYTFAWNDVNAGTYVLTARATDNGGASANSAAVNIVVNNSNQTPIAYAGGPYSGANGSAIQLNGSASQDPDGSIISSQWNFGDNTTGAGSAPIHTYASAGTYTATLTVTDNLGATATANATINVFPATDQPPVANPGGPYSPNAGTSVQFTGSGSYDPDGTITNYVWNFGDDGTASVTNPTHTFTAAGSHLVSLTVTDNLGVSSSKSINVVVKSTGENHTEAVGDVVWDPTNRPSMDDPRNDRGNAANGSTGNNNFQVVAPVLSLPGRGMDLTLNLVHNALLWNKSGTEIFFDIDHDMPAPGWQLGFGKMVAMGSAGAMMIEPDGTRHAFTGQVVDTVYTSPGLPPVHVPTFKGKTTDGSLIEYRCEMGGKPRGVARYPNGIVVSYANYSLDFTHGHNYTYPYFIADANGNSISIKYLQDTSEPRIERIIDSVGRVIAFHYDSQKRLTSISGPGQPDANGNATTRTFVRLHYKTQVLNLNGAFSGLSPRINSPNVNNSSFSAIDAIYYPGTGTGYWFGASDSYSSYGMLTKVMEERGMGFVPAASPDEQGTILEGTVTRQQVYSYPSSPSGLTAAPTYSNVTESWDGGPSSVTTTFEILDNSAPNERKVTIIHPDQTKTIQKSFNFNNPPEGDPNKFKDGAIKEEQSVDSSGRILKSTTYDWEQGPDGAPRLLQTNVTDELGQTLITKYSLYGENNSIGKVTDYDYDGTTAIRTTRTSFTSYTDSDLDLGLDTYYVPFHIIHPRLLSLPQSAKTYAGDDGANKLVSAVEFSYDEYATPLMAYPTDCNSNYDLFSFGETRVHPVPIGILSHSQYWNPSPFPTQPNCDGGAGNGYIIRRGNATTIKTYADTSNPDAPASPIIETRTYDMTGNVIATSKNCCEKTSSAFELASQYAFPASQTRGAADPNSLLQVTTKAAYHLATGLPYSRTDANGREVTFSYFSDSLRPKEIKLSTGAQITFDYDDAAMKVTSATRLSANGTITDKSIKAINGLGQVVQEQSLVSSGINGGNDVWDFVDTNYDQFGRLYRQSRPYRIGDVKQWKETIYDNAGRVSELREPYANAEDLTLNGTVTRYFYNESTRPQGASSALGQTTRIEDPWGRWRWSRTDSSGHLAEVVEPVPAASEPSVFAATKYYYDAVGNLIKVEQGSQVRRFAYDSLGRLTRQKLAEAAATLNAAGERATSEPEDQRWSEVFAYDGRSNLIWRTDARGVRTNYSYQSAGVDDPLNRLQSISYDLSRVDTNSLTVLPAPPVSYQYRTKTSSTQLKDITQLEQVTTGATGSLISTEFFAYDDEGRAFEKRLTFGGRNKPMTLTYEYDSLSRIKQTTYPEQYHDDVQNPARKIVTRSFDESSRETGLKVNNIDYASQVSFNPSSQITSLMIGAGSNQLSETYQFDPKSGLLTNQSLQRNGSSLMNLTYGYRKDPPCPPAQNCPDVYHSTAYTGQVTSISDGSKYEFFAYDALGRLQHVDQWYKSSSSTWSQDYSYDRYGNRTGTVSTGNSGGSPVPRDGYQALAYDTATNQITSSGFSYDPAGNQTTNGTGQTMTYDAAGRLVKVKDANNVTVATYTYGSSNQRLITQTGDENSTAKTYYIWDGSSVLVEYTEQVSASMPKWSRNYVYFGSRLLATEEPNGSGGEVVRYHHPDRLGTRVVTNNADTTYFEQVHLPFGTALDAESTGITNRRFTSYDRSAATGLDYAVNRHYDSRQGRFTQPDPLGLKAASLADPQSLNMYSYAGNDPVNRDDPDGQFWGALIHFVVGLFHNLKPNVVTGSFTYHNQPPISVSFTTDFRNMGVGYGGIGVPVRAGGHWLNPLSPEKTLCDHLEDKLWDLFKNHSNEVGVKAPGSHRGKTITDCFIYAQNVLAYAYRQIGQVDIAKTIEAGFENSKGEGEFGTGMAKYLKSLGWKSYYWNPDVKNPKDGDSAHSFTYQLATQTGKYYGVPVDAYVINYLKTNPASKNEMTQFDEFSKVRFAFGLTQGGNHNFLYSYGMLYEVHWNQSDPSKLYERSSFYSFGQNGHMLSGIWLTPPDCK